MRRRSEAIQPSSRRPRDRIKSLNLKFQKSGFGSCRRSDAAVPRSNPSAGIPGIPRDREGPIRSICSDLLQEFSNFKIFLFFTQLAPPSSAAIPPLPPFPPPPLIWKPHLHLAATSRRIVAPSRRGSRKRRIERAASSSSEGSVQKRRRN